MGLPVGYLQSIWNIVMLKFWRYNLARKVSACSVRKVCCISSGSSSIGEISCGAFLEGLCRPFFVELFKAWCSPHVQPDGTVLGVLRRSRMPWSPSYWGSLGIVPPRAAGSCMWGLGAISVCLPRSSCSQMYSVCILKRRCLLKADIYWTETPVLREYWSVLFFMSLHYVSYEVHARSVKALTGNWPVWNQHCLHLSAQPSQRYLSLPPWSQAQAQTECCGCVELPYLQAQGFQMQLRLGWDLQELCPVLFSAVPVNQQDCCQSAQSDRCWIKF